MRSWRTLFSRGPKSAPSIHVAHLSRLRDGYARLDDDSLKQVARRTTSLPEMIGLAAVVVSRVLGLQLFDVQLQGALALGSGTVVEMQTGEGKTVTAVPAIAWYARTGPGVHVLTANDYLARRDADWMREVYAWFGLSVASIGQDAPPDARRAAYAADVTYATANEIGFDYLRDGLAIDPHERVSRAFATAVIDEADSILIDEARIPLVIAGGSTEAGHVSVQADRAVRELLAHRHYTVDGTGRLVLLTPAGVAQVERVFGLSNLFDDAALALHTAVQDALHAYVLLRKDCDYVVQNGVVLSVDELKGRIAPDRRWPAGLQAALECKEGVARRTQGRVLGSISVENLVALYPRVCGMTGTAATQSDEFLDIYGLDVVVLPTHRPVARIDAPDRRFATREEKDAAVVADIRAIHATGRPVLVGTASVEESEVLSRRLGALPHHVLNARHEEAEAAIVARAGARGAVTISTNMAGRGVDIALGPGVADLGGLHVIGTNRHDSRRIDHQLRGRCARQGDPGSSGFFVSREDPLFARLAADDPAAPPDHVQRIAEGQHRDLRIFLRKYEAVLEGQRLAMRDRRDRVLTGETPSPSDDARVARLAAMDDLWADFLAAATELRSAVTWVSLGYGDPFRHYLTEIHAMFGQMVSAIDAEAAARLARVRDHGLDPRMRGATWTYLTTDEPFGRMTTRIVRRLAEAWRARHAGRLSVDTQQESR